MNANKMMFRELDKHSGQLREVAHQLADLVDEMHTPEMQRLIIVLREMETVPIEKVDVALNNFIDAYSYVFPLIQDKTELLKSPKFQTFASKHEDFAKAAKALDQKAKQIYKLSHEE